MPKISRTHNLIYFVKESNAYITTTPRMWMHANPYHFTNANPRDSQIEKYLEKHFGFTRVENARAVVLHNFALRISPYNGLPLYR